MNDNNNLAETINARIRKRNTSIAVIFGLIGPGVGQIYCGRFRRALIVFALDIPIAILSMVLMIYQPVGIPSFWVGLLLYPLYRLGVAYDSQLLAQRSGEMVLKSYQRWWLYPLFIVLFVSGQLLSEFAIDRIAFTKLSLIGPAMADTLIDGDRILADRFAYQSSPITRGDIIVFVDNGLGGITVTQRVIGLPGDHIEIRNEKVFVNGQLLDEPYATFDQSEKAIEGLRKYPRLATYGPETIAPETLFVLGDNRRLSNDSRLHACIPTKDVIGKARVIYMSKPDSRVKRKKKSQVDDKHEKSWRQLKWKRFGQSLN